MILRYKLCHIFPYSESGFKKNAIINFKKNSQNQSLLQLSRVCSLAYVDDDFNKQGG